MSERSLPYLPDCAELEFPTPPDDARDGCRIAIYSQDSLGLGHLRRTILIGERILQARPNASVLLFADSPVAPFFVLPRGMDHVKLPGMCKMGGGCWQPTRLHANEEDLVRGLRTRLLLKGIVGFNPDLLLVDHMPGGARGELLPTLRKLTRCRPGCRIVLGLRDILDSKEEIARVWTREGAYNAVQQFYERVLIYGTKEFFDADRVYAIPSPKGGIHYCGYVVNQAPVKPKPEIRQQFGSRLRRTVFVCAGGGGDSHLVMRTYLQAIRLLGSRLCFRTLMAVGVNAPDELKRELEKAAAGLPVKIVPFVEDSTSYLASADLVVCMAGYNTISEILYLRKKALVIPRQGPSAEQSIRTKLLAERRLIDMLEPQNLLAERLAAKLLEDLERTDLPATDPGLPMNGAQQASVHLLTMLSQRGVTADPRRNYGAVAG